METHFSRSLVSECDVQGHMASSLQVKMMGCDWMEEHSLWKHFAIVLSRDFERFLEFGLKLEWKRN